MYISSVSGITAPLAGTRGRGAWWVAVVSGADIDDRKVILNRNNAALDGTAFGGRIAGIALGQKQLKIFKGGVSRIADLAMWRHILASDRGWPGGKPARTSLAKAPVVQKGATQAASRLQHPETIWGGT